MAWSVSERLQPCRACSPPFGPSPSRSDSRPLERSSLARQPGLSIKPRLNPNLRRFWCSRRWMRPASPRRWMALAWWRCSHHRRPPISSSGCVSGRRPLRAPRPSHAATPSSVSPPLRRPTANGLRAIQNSRRLTLSTPPMRVLPWVCCSSRASRPSKPGFWPLAKPLCFARIH